MKMNISGKKKKKLRFFQDLISIRQAVIVLQCQLMSRLFHVFMQEMKKKKKKKMHEAIFWYTLHYKQLHRVMD